MEESTLFNEKPIIAKWVADMYDQTATDTRDVEFLIEIIGNKPKKILEVCCGSGRILVPLAKAGHTVYGIDFDEYSLAKINEKAKGLDNIHWKTADAVNDDWNCGYDVVVLAGNILYNIISDMDHAKAQELFIKKAAEALTPGGYVYIEYQPGFHRVTQSVPSYNSRDGEWVVWAGTDSNGNHGKMVLIGDRYDLNTRLSSFTRRFELTLANGETITQNILSEKHFASLEQIHKWLHNAGFVIEQEYGDTDKSVVNAESRGVIIYAKKV